MLPNNDLGYAKACQLFDKTTSRIDQSLQTNIDFLKMILVFGFVINIFLIILLLKK